MATKPLYNYQKVTVPSYKAKTPTYNTVSGSIPVTRKLTSKQRQRRTDLGFTPKTLPGYRSEQSQNKDLTSKVFDLLQRFESAGTGALSEVLKDFQTSSKRDGNTVGAVLRAPLNAVGGLVEGGFGDTEYTGQSLVSQFLDDPSVDKNNPIKGLTDNDVFRGGVGFLAGAATDISNFIPIGKLAKGAGVVGKTILPEAVLTKTDDLFKIAKESITGSKAFKKAASTLSREYGRTDEFIKAIDKLNITEAFGSEVSGGFNKLLRGTIDDKGVGDLLIDLKRIVTDKDTYTKLASEVENAYDVIKKSGVPDQEKLFKVITNVIDDASDIGEISKPIRTMIDDVLTPQLVESGIIDAETAAQGSGNYLRLLYQRLGVPEEEAARLFTQSKTGLKLGKEAGALKRRKNDVERLFEFLDGSNIKNADEILTYRNAYQEAIKTGDVDTINQIDNIIRQLLPENKIKEFAFLRRKDVGLISDASLVAPETIEQQVRLIERYSFLDWTSQTLAKDFDNATQALQAGYKQIPNTEKYGNLAGKYIPEIMADDVIGIINPPKNVLTRITNIWKKGKLFAPFNFATNSRNAISNMALNSMVEDGIPVYRLDRYLQAMREIENAGPLYKQAREAGLFVNTFASQEVRSELAAQTPDLISKTDNFLNKFTQGRRIKGTPIGYGQEAFAFTEDMGKLAQFIYQVKDKGKTAEEAVQVAEKALFNYSKLPVGMQKIRDQFIPFLSFKYFSTQLAIDTLINRTSRLTNFNRAKGAVEALTANQENEQDLPDYIKDSRELVLRTPWLDEQGNPRYIDLKYLYPFGDVGSGFEPQDVILGNPFARIAVEQGINRNLFFDQPIAREGQTPMQQLQARGESIINAVLPKSPVIPGSYDFNKIVDAARGVPDYAGRPQDLASTLTDTVLGIKARRVDPQEQRQKNQASVDAQQAEIQGEINRIKKDQRLSRRQKSEMIQQLQEQKRNVKL